MYRNSCQKAKKCLSVNDRGSVSRSNYWLTRSCVNLKVDEAKTGNKKFPGQKMQENIRIK